MVSTVDIINYLRHWPIHLDTLGDIEVDRDSIVVGNNSVIARCSIKGIEGDKSLKCYYRPLHMLHNVDNSHYIRCGLCIPTLAGTVAAIDVLISEWIDGEPLSDVIHDKDCNFKILSRAFDTLAYDILSREYVHCDITPDNIIVNGDQMYLIDMDAVQYPEFEHRVSEGYGTPRFSHRHRGFSSNKHIDDYPLAAISTILAALATYRSRQRVPQLLIEFGYDNLRDAITFAQQRLLDKRDMVHYQIGAETTNLLGKIPNLGKMLAIALGIERSPSSQNRKSSRKCSTHATRPWTLDEDERLVMWLTDQFTIDSICTALHRTPNDVRHRIKSLSIDIPIRNEESEMLLFDDMMRTTTK